MLMLHKQLDRATSQSSQPGSKREQLPGLKNCQSRILNNSWRYGVVSKTCLLCWNSASSIQKVEAPATPSGRLRLPAESCRASADAPAPPRHKKSSEIIRNHLKSSEKHPKNIEICCVSMVPDILAPLPRPLPNTTWACAHFIQKKGHNNTFIDSRAYIHVSSYFTGWLQCSLKTMKSTFTNAMC